LFDYIVNHRELDSIRFTKKGREREREKRRR